MWFTRILSSVAFLAAIVFSIPLAFDVGGRTCGLAFSLTLTTYYFIFSILRLSATSASRLRLTLINIYGWLQWLVIPTLLIWSLNKFSVDPDVGGSWIDRTFKAKQPARLSFSDRIFGRDGIAETAIIGSWDKVLRWSTPIFQIAEGFCSLLVIQATGRITKWLVNSERGESWMVSCSVLKRRSRLGANM